MSAVVLIAAQPTRGASAGRAALFALERLGHAVWFVPTTLTARPSASAAPRFSVPDDAVAHLLADLTGAARQHDVAAILTGGFATPGQVAAAASAIQALKAERPDLVYLCDIAPDDEATAAVARDLMPLADIVTLPLAALAGLTATAVPDSTAATLAAARRLLRPTVLVTAAPALMRAAAATLLVESDSALQAEHPRIANAPEGGDALFAALFLAQRLAGRGNAKALERAAAATFDMTARAARGGFDTLPLGAEHDVLATSLASVTIRQIGAAARPARAPKPVALG